MRRKHTKRGDAYICVSICHLLCCTLGTTTLQSSYTTIQIHYKRKKNSRCFTCSSHGRLAVWSGLVRPSLMSPGIPRSAEFICSLTRAEWPKVALLTSLAVGAGCQVGPSLSAPCGLTSPVGEARLSPQGVLGAHSPGARIGTQVLQGPQTGLTRCHSLYIP